MLKNIYTILVVICVSLFASKANSHPHVFLEANLEIFKNEKGEVTEIRQVWRFDELFTTSVILDFDSNGSGSIETNELKEVEKIIKKNLKEFDYYTAIRLDDEIVEFDPPQTFLADFDGEQIVLILGFELKQPINIIGKEFSVSVSDPTYYVAVDMKDESSVNIAGNKQGCKYEIVRPDFDKLYATNPEVFKDDFQGSDDPEVFSADDYLTWVDFNCV